jgi:hypothetical protein
VILEGVCSECTRYRRLLGAVWAHDRHKCIFYPASARRHNAPAYRHRRRGRRERRGQFLSLRGCPTVANYGEISSHQLRAVVIETLDELFLADGSVEPPLTVAVFGCCQRHQGHRRCHHPDCMHRRIHPHHCRTGWISGDQLSSPSGSPSFVVRSATDRSTFHPSSFLRKGSRRGLSPDCSSANRR